MLLLKLFLVPAFLVLITLAGRRWGAARAGWLAGLPVVGGPILFFLAIEQGTAFAATAATSSLAAVFASVTFNVAYAHRALRSGWGPALLMGLLAWLVAATSLSVTVTTVAVAAVIALATLMLAPRAFPTVGEIAIDRPMRSAELILRAVVGAALTLAVTLAASKLGPGWSGLLTVFPVLGIVLAVFSHRFQGGAFAATLLRAMATGLYAFAAFCLVLALTLEPMGIAGAFLLSVLASLAVQMATRRSLIADRAAA